MKSKGGQTENPPAGSRDVAEGLARIDDACAFLSVSRSKLYCLMESGELKYATIGKCRRIPWAALRSFAASCLVGA